VLGYESNWGEIVQRAVRAVLVVFISPSLDNAPGFFQSVKQIAVDTFLSELTDEAFDVSILPIN